ncbi:hypothetical protein QO009_003008 [Brevibacillus aydinogluensis]|uniref:hypothetical protein n=1 Tax=Brevibacillus aydinogluensis TaxID=927786 RepID=UPI0028936C15|nr:hypothetical protein [Brevibacillus aydinogluensis]MDT3417113.1 hypothetical protein [Brevibacillus aydinogluensis]
MKIFVKRDRFKTYQESRIVLESADEWTTLRMALSVGIEQCKQMLDRVACEEEGKHWQEMLERYQRAYDDLNPANEIRE